MKPDDFLDQLLPAALSCQRSAGIPASFTLAQAALESAWGESRLARDGHNLFGVKADASWHGPTVEMNTGEIIGGQRVMVPAKWRAYPTWLDCLNDRAKFFLTNPRYAKCFAEKTGEGWARAVPAAGYCTDPAYAAKLIEIIHGRNLTRFDQPEGEKQ